MPRLTGISRRQFLRRSSAFVVMAGGMQNTPPVVIDERVAQAVALAGTSLGLPPEHALRGRAFVRIPARLRPEHNSPIVARLMEDSVHPLIGISPDGWWYETPSGWVQRELLQPIATYEAPPLSAANGYLEVVAPITPVRDYCSPLASVAARLPFGAVLYGRDRITDDRGQAWYGVTTGGEDASLWGWVQAAHMRPWTAPTSPVAAEPAVWIDTEQCKLSAYDGERLLGECAVYCPPMPPGAGRLMAYIPSMPPGNVFRSGRSAVGDAHQPPIKTWVIAVQPDAGSAVKMYGAYWHNVFGLHDYDGDPDLGASLELPTFAARWLYELVVSASAGDVPVIIE